MSKGHYVYTLRNAYGRTVYGSHHAYLAKDEAREAAYSVNGCGNFYGMHPFREHREGPRPKKRRSGKSRGVGSKSRLLLWECACQKPVKVRHAGTQLDVRCNVCSTDFQLRTDSLPPAHKGD